MKTFRFLPALAVGLFAASCDFPFWGTDCGPFDQSPAALLAGYGHASITAAHGTLDGEPLTDLQFQAYSETQFYYREQSYARIRKVSDRKVDMELLFTWADESFALTIPSISIDGNRERIEIERQVIKKPNDVVITISGVFDAVGYGTRCSPAEPPNWKGELALECTWGGRTLVLDSFTVETQPSEPGAADGIAMAEWHFSEAELANFQSKYSYISLRIIRISESRTEAHMSCKTLWGLWREEYSGWTGEGRYDVFEIEIPGIPVSGSVSDLSFDYTTTEAGITHDQQPYMSPHTEMPATVTLTGTFKGIREEGGYVEPTFDLAINCSWEGTKSLQLKFTHDSDK